MEPMIQVENLCKSFSTKNGTVEAARNISFSIEKGEIFGIIGLSGAGKSTLVRCLNLLERPTSGTVRVNGKNLTKLSEKELRKERQNIGMIFQHFNLLMQRTALDNVCFPMEIAGISKKEARKKALEYLKVVGLEEKALSYPSQLSGGQKQRVAIARVLASDPKILLCDEATSALDPQTTKAILELIKEINRDYGITVVVITHEMSVVQEICNRVAVLESGTLVESGTVEELFRSPKTEAARRLVFSGRTQIQKIETLPDKTLVVLSVPIHYDCNWLVINKGLCIVDCKTGDEYPVLEEAHGIEMNKLLWVEGCQGRSVLLTLVFPKLPKRVKTIDFYNKYPDAGIISPTNGSSWNWWKIKIKDYQKEPYKRVIL